MNKLLLAPTLDDEAVALAKRDIGRKIHVEQWNYEATRDTIRHYAWGIGDDNPLWSNPDYAADTRWGGIIAPPTFPYAIFDAVVAPGLPDIQWIYSGADWTFHAPIHRNDTIEAGATLADVTEVSGKRVSRMLVQTGDVHYTNQNGDLVAQAKSHCFRIPRAGAEGGLKYEQRDEPTHSPEELEKIERAVLEEYVRGRDTLRWDDVEPGAPIPTIVRGPINRLDMTCYYAGAVGTSGYKSTKLKWKYAHWARHAPENLPDNYDPSYYAAAVSPSIGHQDAAVAQSEIGMPGPYDNGPQRIGFMASCVTNWMGDDAFMRNLSVRVKLPVIFGDTTLCKGKVRDKSRDEKGQPIVDLEIWAENQLGDVTAKGTASILLAE